MMRMLVLALVSTLTVLTVSGMSPALPEIAKAFAAHANGDLLSRVMLTTPALTLAISAPLIGIYSDRFGRRRLLLIAVASYVVVGSAGLYIDSLMALIMSRALLGVCAGTISGTVTALIADYYEGLQRQRALGLQASMLSLSGALFAVLSGTLADVGWRIPFALYFLGVPCFLLAYLYLVAIPSHKQPAPEIKPLRPGLITTPRRLYGVAFVALTLFFMVIIELPFYLQMSYHLGNTQVGLVTALMAASSAIAALNFSRLGQRMALHWMLMMSCAVMGLACVMLALAGRLEVALLALVILGLGTGVLIPNMSAQLAALVVADKRARYFGGLMTAIFLGQFVSPFVSRALLRHLPDEQALFLVVAVGSLCLLGAVHWLSNKQLLQACHSK